MFSSSFVTTMDRLVRLPRGQHPYRRGTTKRVRRDKINIKKYTSETFDQIMSKTRENIIHSSIRLQVGLKNSKGILQRKGQSTKYLHLLVFKLFLCIILKCQNWFSFCQHNSEIRLIEHSPTPLRNFPTNGQFLYLNLGILS